MNKMMVFPLAFLLILSIFSAINTGITYTGHSQDMSDIDGFVINDSETTISVPEAEEQEFDIWQGTYAIFIVVTAMGIGIIAGITVLGSGLKDYSAKLMFDGILFLGLWTCLSVVTIMYMFMNVFTTLFWIGLTVMYTIGVGNQMSQKG